jgi:serine/threonine-protein kinase RsbW
MEEYQFTVGNDLAQIEPAQADLEAALKTSGIRLHVIYALNMALGEWLENVIRHAWPGGGAHSIDVVCQVLEDEIRLRVTDDGCEFDPTRATASAAASAENAPRGLHLIRSLMSELRHERANGRNVFTMTRLLSR